MKSVNPTTEPTADEAVAKRRHFLLGATVGTAGVVAAAVTGRSVGELAEVTATRDKGDLANTKQSGYRLTPHIAHYYRTTEM